MLIVALAPVVPVVVVGAAFFGAGSGMFLAVDWALMTDIIPKASSGRYMGISNVATATAGIFSLLLGGKLMDIVNGIAGYGAGPRAAFLLAVVFFALGAILLRPVVEPRLRGAVPAPAVA
jgi:MFS family permease